MTRSAAHLHACIDAVQTSDKLLLAFKTHFTPPTPTRQNCFVGSGWRRWCEHNSRLLKTFATESFETEHVWFFSVLSGRRRRCEMGLKNDKTIECGPVNLLNSNTSSTCPHKLVNFSHTNGWDRFVSLGHPSKFQQVSILGVIILHRRRSPEANQSLHGVWPSPGLVHYVHIGGLLPPKGILSGAKFALRPSLAFSYIGSVNARHWSSGRQSNFAA